MRVILLFFVTVLASCQQYIKVVDHTGKPLVGAVVLSEEGPAFWWWDVGASVVGKTGGVALANWVSPHTVYIFHKGFHTARGGHRYLGGSIKNGLATLYPKKRPGNVVVIEEEVRIDREHEGQTLPFTISRCKGVSLIYDSEEEILKATAKENILYPSDQFLFLGASNDSGSKIIESHDGNEIIFYCKIDQSDFEKFSIAGSGQFSSINPNGRTFGYRVFSLRHASVPALDFSIEPRSDVLEPKLTIRSGVPSTCSFPTLHMNTSLEEFRTAYQQHLPEDTPAEREFKEAWLKHFLHCA